MPYVRPIPIVSGGARRGFMPGCTDAGSVDAPSDSRYREGLARLLLAACLLLFAISIGVLVLVLAALGPPGFLGGFAFIASIAFMLIGFGLAFDGFALMARRQV